MPKDIHTLNARFSATRRAMLRTVPMLAMAPSLAALAQSSNGPAIRLRKLNGFEIAVSDPGRSIEFYQGLFGMPVQARNGDRVSLRIGDGPQFMAVRPLREGESSRITHLGYSVEDYEPERLLGALGDLGYERIDPPAVTAPGLDNAMKAWVRMRGDTPEVYFADERGLIVHLSDLGFCGGSGPLGDQCQVEEGAPDPMIQLREINHFTAFVSDGAGANTYYQDTFGLEVQAYQGPGSPVTGIGDGKQFVMYAGPFPGGEDAPANIHHSCFSMEGFEVDRVRALLSGYGLSPRGDNPTGPMVHYVSLRMPERGGAEGGTPELYFTDPDGILMQLQHTSYCGGGGELGEICEA